MSPSTAESPAGQSTTTPQPAFVVQKRVVLGKWEACSPCRYRKVRCDGDQPACKSCIYTGRRCVYAEKESFRGPPSYVELDAKFKALQAHFRKLLEDRVANPRLVKTPPVLDFSANDRQLLFGLFFQYQHRSNSAMVQSRFMSSLRAKEQNLRPHPALIDTILLFGLLFARRTSKTRFLSATIPDDGALLARVHKRLESSLGLVDRLLDYLQASTLLCGWYFYHGRLQEGHYISVTTLRLAVCCHLHRIDEAVLREVPGATDRPSFWDDTILGRPRDYYELHSRVAIFWQAYSAESLNCLVAGLPHSCDDSASQHVTTIWPVSPEGCEMPISTKSPAKRQQLFKSIDQLLSGATEDDPRSEDTIHSINMKALVLLSRATDISAEAASLYAVDRQCDIGHCEKLIERANLLAFALQKFISKSPAMDTVHQRRSLSQKSLCFGLFARLSECTARLHLIQAAETLTKLKSTYAATRESQPDIDLYGIVAPLTLADTYSFDEMTLAVAQSAIRPIYDILNGDEASAYGLGGSNQWPDQIPAPCGFFIASSMLVVARYIRKLENRLKSTASDQNLPPYSLATLMLEGAEGVFKQGYFVMSSLSSNLPLLRLQIERIQQARGAPTENEKQKDNSVPFVY